MFNAEYVKKIIDRTNARINNLNQRLLAVTPGRTMPDTNQVTIGSGRQMEVAILFLDICNYTRWFSDSYDAQKAVLAIMNIFMAEMMNIVRDNNGTFEKNTGDGLMAYFGTDTAKPEECVTSAIDAALTMHYFNDNLLSPYLLRQGARETLKFRIGIDYGKITIGRVGVPGGLNSFVAIGTTANIACRLLDIASEGEIAIGSHVKNHLATYRQQYCQLIPENSGFEYIQSGFPYFAYKYTGRWKQPQLS